MASKAVSVKLEDAERSRLAALADARKRSTHYLMREAIVEFLDREEKRAAFIKEALEALDDFETTGLHVTLEDMEQWVDALETDPSKPLPPWRV
jgi:predicted transcriptional regulator